jgi:octaprenyl-diphosphate synthase
MVADGVSCQPRTLCAFPNLHAPFRRGSEKERDFWRSTLERGEVEEGDLETAIAAMHAHRALEDMVERARHYGAMARDALELFPASDWKAALIDVVDFCIERVH